MIATGLFDALAMGAGKVGAAASGGLLARQKAADADRLLNAKLAAMYGYHQAQIGSKYDIAGMGIDQKQRAAAERDVRALDQQLNDTNRQADFQRFPGLRERMIAERQEKMEIASGQRDWRQYKPSPFVDPVTGQPATAQAWQPGPGQTAADNPYLSERGLLGQRRVDIGQENADVNKGFKGGLLTHFGNQDAMSGTRLNADLAQRQFTDTMAQAKELLEAGHLSFQEQETVWSKLLTAAGQTAKAGGNPGAILKPFLFNHGAMGYQTPNVPAITGYLKANGFSDSDVQNVLGGTQPGGGVANQFSAPGQPDTAVKGMIQETGGAPSLPPVSGGGPNLSSAENFATGQGYRVTSTTGGEHNPGSLHYQGRALDVSVRGKSPQEVQQFMEAAKAQGYGVRDERAHPAGQAVWGGPHIHLEWGPQTKPNAAAALGFSEPGGPEGSPGGGTVTMPPAATPGAGAKAMGINLPATAPPVKNPYHPGSLEDEVFKAYTHPTSPLGAKTILNQFKDRPDLVKRASDVIDATNVQQGSQGLLKGMPVQSTNGAELPNVPDFSGGQVHIPGASIFGTVDPKTGKISGPGTTPVVMQGGFGAGPGAPASPASPPAVSVDMPSPPSAAPVGISGGGGMVDQPGSGLPPVTGKMPPFPSGPMDLGLWNQGAGPAGGLSGAAPAPPPGPGGLMDLPTRTPGPPAPPQGASYRSEGVSGGYTPGQAPESISTGPGPTVSAKGSPALTKSIGIELQQFRRLPYSSAVEKLFRDRGITDPAQQQSLYRWTTSELLPRLRTQLPQLGEKGIYAQLPAYLDHYVPH